MYLKKISLLNFKNFDSFEYLPNKRINCFIGDNGIGKTNLLDSIHYLALCKSFINSVDKMNIKFGNDYFIIDGIFERNNSEENIYCSVHKNKNKTFKKNNIQYQKLSEHIGFLPLVYTTPSDISLINGGSELRRKFVDSIISQFDKQYLNSLISYNKALEQRNHLLKNFSEKAYFDIESIEIWDLKLIEFGEYIHSVRKKFSEAVSDFFQYYYNSISNKNEKVELFYHSQLNDNELKVLLKNYLERDRILKFSTCGIHKDDFDFILNNHSIKKNGSQGQQKTYIISLKFAQFDYLKQNINISPILLLDDIFDKLDDKRVSKIIELVTQKDFGQIFITDTCYDKMPNILNKLDITNKIFNLATNKII